MRREYQRESTRFSVIKKPYKNTSKRKYKKNSQLQCIHLFSASSKNTRPANIKEQPNDSKYDKLDAQL